MVYNDAIRFIRYLNDEVYLGNTNWRLPTISELSHLYHEDGISWAFRDAAAASPFENLGAMYWAQDVKSFDFGNGVEISFAAYRHVLPVASQSRMRYPLPIFKMPRYPYPYPRPWPRRHLF